MSGQKERPIPRVIHVEFVTPAKREEHCSGLTAPFPLRFV